MSLFRLIDVVEIFVDIVTMRVRCTIRFFKFKGRGEGNDRCKTFSGFLNDPFGPIYHLHYRLLELTGGKMGLLRCHSTRDSIFGWKNDPKNYGIVDDDIRRNDYETFVQYIDRPDNDDMKNWFVFCKPTDHFSPTTRHAQMIKRRFAHYPAFFVDRFVFHSLRAGFYVQTVFNIARQNVWNIAQAFDVAKFVGEWRVRTGE